VTLIFLLAGSEVEKMIVFVPLPAVLELTVEPAL
jgi:hypothetical protein